jgi:hypothetical protein
VKVFWLHPAAAGGWLSPAEVVERLRAVFDSVSADRDEGRELGELYVNLYRAMRAAGVGASDSAPVETVERQWSDAVVIRAADAGESSAPFETLVRRDYRLELRFARGTHFRRKQRAAAKAAAALGYVVDCFEPEE